VRDPVESFEHIQSSIKRYITSAFGTNSPTFELDRKELLDKDAVLFQEPFVEPIPSYESSKTLAELTEEDLPGMPQPAIEAFRSIVAAGLFKGGYPLYTHQQRMLQHALMGKHCVVVTGTGSGKTESFLLPVLANLIKEAVASEAPWKGANPTDIIWTKSSLPKWNETHRNVRRETRPAAIRTLILYPMNALVEDQLSRLRSALDTDSAHEAQDCVLDKNRIRFGRYNGSTPVSGHPFNVDGSPKQEAHDRLTKALSDAIGESAGVTLQIRKLSQEFEKAKIGGDQDGARALAQELEKVREQASFNAKLRQLPRSIPNFRWKILARTSHVIGVLRQILGKKGHAFS
jgi:DEAD/DEAH box helicase domain-containing protein